MAEYCMRAALFVLAITQGIRAYLDGQATSHTSSAPE
jgi:hypothetical protein